MLNLNFIAFRIPFLVILVSALMAVAMGYLTTLKMGETYERLEHDGAIAAIQGIRPLIAQKAAAGDCDGIKAALDELLKNSMVSATQVVVADLDMQCNYTNGVKITPESAFKTLALYDTDNVMIGELTVGYSLDAILETQISDFNRVFYIATAIYFLVLFAIMHSLVKMLRPLREITREMDAFDPEHPEEFVLYKAGNDEVAQLARSAGKMFDMLVNFARRIHASNSDAMHSESHLKEAQRMAKIGSWEYTIDSDSFTMSTEMYRLLRMNTKNDNVTWEQFLAFVSEGDKEYVRQVVNDAITHGSKFHMGYRLKTANGEMIEVHTYGKVRKKTGGKVRITGVTRDVTEQNRTQRMIEQLAYFDLLTNLPNRALLKDRLGKAIDAAKRSHGKVAVLFLDLDHFKLINDTLGHHIGDKLLVYVAETLSKQLRGSDTISRIGGDEFVVLLPQVKDCEDAQHVAEKLLESLEGQHVIERHALYISTSIGVALYPDHAEQITDLIKHADTAMYEAKQQGRNNYKTYHRDMNGQQYGQLLLEEHLYEAVKTKERFKIHYQPQIDMQSKGVCGLEALIRWDHQEQGLLEPDQFIPMMEASDMIIETGYWVLETVVAQIAKWQKDGKPALPVSINLSARQLQDENLSEQVAQTLESYGVDASLLCFEVSEGILMSNIEGYTSQLQRLKKCGVSLAVDDYGSSLSSIPVLSQFPVDVLKIDQRFVSESVDEAKELKNIAAMVAMAGALGMTAVIEGVEDDNQLEMVKELPCGRLQGYLYSKPLGVDDLEAFLEAYRPGV